MDKSTEKETHDFMNVESFSQLPFIRPAPIKEKCIKLFGIEFGGDNPDDSESAETNINACEVDAKDQHTENVESNRRFECHYCCRNFPTSQALGGHQNAHKRERQHAKRAHLQSAMMHSSLSDHSQVYGFMNYSHGSAPMPPMTSTYPSWNPLNSNTIGTTAGNGSRYYGNQGSFSQRPPVPIDGSPLSLWRMPAVQISNPTLNRDRSSHPLPLFAGDEMKQYSQLGGSSSQSRYVYESKPSVKDHGSRWDKKDQVISFDVSSADDAERQRYFHGICARVAHS